ncbi:IS3 family transposase [Paenibacillus sp. Leaf72]|uniref:IS3 family transposase n=1 Tax=Paenibacillus sp. Leaf72 TaxID=1736234 RepID=UPI003FA76017
MTYINFYKYERLRAKLNGLSPMKFRTKAAQLILFMDKKMFLGFIKQINLGSMNGCCK